MMLTQYKFARFQLPAIRLLWPVSVAFVLTATSVAAAGDKPKREGGDRRPQTGKIDFVRDIRPIFASRCFTCHGRDEQEAGLRLDRKGDAIRGGDSGKAIIPKDSRKSLLIRLVTERNTDESMMPPEGERLTNKQVGLLRAWIDQGAVWPDAADKVLLGSDHWAFKSVKRPTVPRVQKQSWVRNPIDAFVLARLERENLAPSPPSDRVTLIRRLSLDLLGLPPTISEVDGFLADKRPGADQRLVDRLLRSKHFGERWGRYWLDLARYADSDGYEDDKYRPDAWRFRDWVVQAINSDLPYDQFTVHQVAGDLMPSATYETRVATGFHRMTLSNKAGGGGIDEEFRVKTAKDRLNTTGSVWLGLTVGCAQCHSHKYDPLSQREYYQLYAFFNNALETDVPAPRLADRYYAAFEQAQTKFEYKLCAAEFDLSLYEQDVLPGKFAAWQETADVETLPKNIARLLLISANDRSAAERLILSDYYLSIDTNYLKRKSAVLDGGEITNNQPLPPSSQALTLTDAVSMRKSYVHRHGNFLTKGDEVQATTPAFLPVLNAGSQGRQTDRLALARWIVDPANPLTSRVAVNRFWQHLFGRGLVTTADDFGINGESPSHPELLDWLAAEFIAEGWSRKAMIRLIVTSRTYQQSARHRGEYNQHDPDNVLLARQNRFRVEAECVRDLALAAGGLLNRNVGGPSIQPPLPDALTKLQALKNERFREADTGEDRYRRGLYVNVQRTFLFPMLKTFDVADANVSCARRDRSNTPLQALTLLNDPVFFEAAEALGRRVLVECQADRRKRIRYAFRLCLAREPHPAEMATLDRLLTRLLNLETPISTASAQASVVSAAKSVNLKEVGKDVSPRELAAWVGLSRTLLNLDEFITRE